MTHYRISVTDLAKAQQALTNEGITSTIQGAYLAVSYEGNKNMELIRILNKARIVVYDIEEVEGIAPSTSN